MKRSDGLWCLALYKFTITHIYWSMGVLINRSWWVDTVGESRHSEHFMLKLYKRLYKERKRLYKEPEQGSSVVKYLLFFGGLHIQGCNKQHGIGQKLIIHKFYSVGRFLWNIFSPHLLFVVFMICFIKFWNKGWKRS